MAEQDKYGSHWSGNPSNPVRDSPQINIENLPKGAGAEQDRYGGWFGGKGPSAEQIQEHLPKASGAEQDRYGGWFGGKAPSAEHLKEKLPTGEKKSSWFSFGKEESKPQPSAAEQDRYGSWFGSKVPSADKIGDKVQEHLPKTSGAEQDRFGGWFGGKSPSAGEIGDKIQEKLPSTSGAEQDRFGRWFGGKSPSAESVGEKIQEKLPSTSGAEQDRYSGWFGGKAPSADKIGDKLQEHLPGTSGAEQDRYGGWFGGTGPSADQIQDRLPHTSGAEQDRYGSHFGTRPGSPVEATPGPSGWTSGRVPSGAEQDRFGSHFSRVRNPVNPGAVGLLQSAILPSFGFHTGTSLIAYGISRYTDRIDGKDWLWPTAPVANAWWSAVGTRVVYDGLSLSDAWSTVTYPEKLLLTGVTAWGGRLFYYIASRSIKRGEDDDRYNTLEKEDPSFWNKALFTKFVPEAVVQTIISLPFTLPFRAGGTSALNSPLSDNTSIAHSLAVFLFTTGFALEVLADSQLQAHKRRSNDLYREGVWSIVRHPNYLGDALIHLSFPALLYSAGIMHPLALLAPVANYLFLRFVGGDKENEASQAERYAKSNPFKYQQLQAYRMDKNSFWPSLEELKNKWTWAVLAVGAGVAILERGARAYLRG